MSGRSRTRRVPFDGPAFGNATIANWMSPRYLFWRISSTVKFAAIQVRCAIRGHDDGQHFRKLFRNGDDIFADETPWCSDCGREATR